MEESKEQAVQERRMEGRKRFITNVIYFVILGGIFLFVMKQLVPMFFPFLLGLTVAAVLSPLIRKLCGRREESERRCRSRCFWYFMGFW